MSCNSSCRWLEPHGGRRAPVRGRPLHRLLLNSWLQRRLQYNGDHAVQTSVDAITLIISWQPLASASAAAKAADGAVLGPASQQSGWLSHGSIGTPRRRQSWSTRDSSGVSLLHHSSAAASGCCRSDAVEPVATRQIWHEAGMAALSCSFHVVVIGDADTRRRARGTRWRACCLCPSATRLMSCSSRSAVPHPASTASIIACHRHRSSSFACAPTQWRSRHPRKKGCESELGNHAQFNRSVWCRARFLLIPSDC